MFARAAAGGCARVEAFDIRDEDAVRVGVARIAALRGRIQRVLNNAGGQFPAQLASISKRGFEAVLVTNLTGGFWMARAV